MWGAIASGIMTGVSSLVSDSFIATQAGLAERMAKAGANFVRYAFNRRAGYRNQEYAQNKWNIEDRADELVGRENAVIGESNFDPSTGDRRIGFDALYRAFKKVEGESVTEAIEYFEDEMNTINDILQYNYQAYLARQQKKMHSGIASIGKALALGVGDALGRLSPKGPKDKVSENVYGQDEFKQWFREHNGLEGMEALPSKLSAEPLAAYYGNKKNALFKSLEKQLGWNSSVPLFGGK